jgi:23S rRNA (cytidine2498-2'-O)-methyltransferase
MDAPTRIPRGSGLAFCSPAYEDVALNELASSLGVHLIERLDHGALIVSAPDFATSRARLEARPTVFTRQLIVELSAIPRNGDVKVDATRIEREWPHAGSTGILVSDAAGRCPHDLAALRSELMSGVRHESGAPPLAVVASSGMLLTGCAVPGAGIPGAPFWPAGRPDLRIDDYLVSRSAFKLLEAIEVFGIPVTPGEQALDLGASPGGWTQVLALRGMAVTAVDPGEIDPRVKALPGVRVFSGTAGEYLRQASAGYDLIVDDMRMDARESARTMIAAQAVLRPAGAVVVTLKLPERSPTAILRQALDILGRAYVEVSARCLYYNRSEVTVCARPCA